MILPANADEIARKIREYLPQFARPMLDRLIARIEYDAARSALAGLAQCREAALPAGAGHPDPMFCPTCERIQASDRRCSLQERASAAGAAAYLRQDER